jgi:hypothetical protein
MLATAAVAAADPPPQAPSEPAPSELDPSEPPLAPPGMAEPVLMPPGLSPIVPDCEHDPNWRDREECADDGVYVTGGVIRGGFGGYFWTGG